MARTATTQRKTTATKRSTAAKKAAQTRSANQAAEARKRTAAAKKAAETRRELAQTAVDQAVQELGVPRVSVAFDVLSDSEKANLQKKLGRGGGLPTGALAQVS